MSFVAQQWAWKQELPPNLKFLLVSLAHSANKEGEAWPNKQSLMGMVGVSRRHLMGQLKKLADMGYIVTAPRYRDNGSQTSNSYTLNLGGGGHNDCPPSGHKLVPPLGAAVGAPPIELTYDLKEELTSTGKPGPEEILGTVKQVIEKNKPLPEDEILSKAHRDEKDVLKPSACGYLWKQYRRTLGASGFQPTLLTEELQFLKKAHNRLGEDNFVAALKAVMRDWIAFTKFAENKGGAFQLPQTPKIKFFLKFCAEAVEFAGLVGDNTGQDWVQPIAKPLTLPKETVENGDTAMSHDEVLAINKEFED